MSDTNIVNGAPQLVLYGTKDNSTRPVPRARTTRPTFLPVTPFYARRGRTGFQMMLSSDTAAQYHTDTFDPTKKWYNHASAFAQMFLGKGNAIMAYRIKPTDAGPIANVTLALEVLETKVPDYERMADGSIKMDANGDPVPNGDKLGGYRVRWVVKHNTGVNADSSFGADTVTPGTLTDTDAVGTAQIYPILSVMESSFGSDGSLTAVRLFAPIEPGTGEKFDSRLLRATKAYPFRFQVLRQNETNQSYSTSTTLSGAQSVLATFKTGVTDPYTAAKLTASDILLKNYRRQNDSILPDVDGFIGNVAIYKSNIDMLLAKFKAAEDAYQATLGAGIGGGVGFQTDFSGAEGEENLFNFLGGTTFSGYPYHTYVMEPSVDGYMPSQTSVLPLAGGSDGTMNDAAFAASVETLVANYADRNSNFQEDAVRVESVFVDSGYPLATKYKLLDFLAQRKDTAVLLSTYESGAPVGDAATEYATGTALHSRVQLYPESTMYGTGPCRAFIMAGSGTIIGSDYTKRVPTLYAAAEAMSDYMGAASGKWKPGKSPTGMPGSEITSMTDLSTTFRPVDQKVLDWNVGLNYAQRFDLESFHFPAWKTVYGDDTSVLTSIFTVFAIIEINKVCQEVHRYYSGVDTLTNLQLADRIDKAVAARLEGRFDSRFLIQVETTFTEQDVARNYSWTTAVRIGAAGQKTVMQAYVEAYRREDLEAQI